MSAETEWAEGRGVDEAGLTVLPLYFWLALVAVALLLSGCATRPQTEVCFMKVMGQTPEGYTVVGTHCMTPEAFAESQK